MPSEQTSLLSAASPESAGMSSERLGRIGEALQREVDNGNIPGAVVGIARHGTQVYLEAIGFRDVTAKAPMATDAVFSIASMTKAMVSVAAMALFEEGRLVLSDPVSKYLPVFSNLKVLAGDAGAELKTTDVNSEPTIQDLLRHTSGLSYEKRGETAAHKLYPGSSIHAAERLTGGEFIARLSGIPLIHQPGTTWEYGFSTDVLGLVIEAIEGRSLGDVLATRIWQPLGMDDTGFALPAAQKDRYALALPDQPPGEFSVIHHTTDKTQKFESGGGGAVSTAPDYLRFIQMLLAGGVLRHRRILGRKTLDLMTADHLTPGMGERIADTMDPASVGYGFGLGFAVRRQAGLSALVGSVGDYYWSGVYGTYFWVDPVEQLAVVFMAAVPGPQRVRYRQMMRALVLQAIIT